MGLSTKTKFIDKSKLSSRPDYYSTIIKLMMVCNDLQTANEGLRYWKGIKDPKRSEISYGSRLYFVKLQWSHLYEGLKMIEEIRNDEALESIVRRCDSKTQKEYLFLQEFITGGSQRREVERYIGRLRSNFTFHYDETGKVLKKVLKNQQSGSAKVTRGSSMEKWRFGIADELLDEIVVNSIWDTSQNGKFQSFSDVEDFAFEIYMSFVNFCGEFIWCSTGG